MLDELSDVDYAERSQRKRYNADICINIVWI